MLPARTGPDHLARFGRALAMRPRRAPIEAGIIAAGDGTRLQASHPALIKPLIPIAGSPLCHWVAGSLRGAGIQSITLLHNSRGRGVPESLQKAFPGLRWSFLDRDTASSWESFRLVARSLAGRAASFIMSTVDALIPPEEVARFAREAGESSARAALALTSFVDDEKPLWADLNDQGLIEALGEKSLKRSSVTCGLYYMTSELALEMPPAASHASLRSYWGALVSARVPVAGVLLSKTMDVDRPQDVQQAEAFLKEATSWQSA